MKIANIICIFNSPSLTERVYKQMKGQVGDLYVLENSTDDAKLFRCPEMIDMGRVNRGFGGMHDFIFSDKRFRKYDFVGIFNNDVYDIPPNYVRALSKYMAHDIGVLASALCDTGTGWNHMRRKAWEGLRDVPHVEDAAAWFNVRLFDRLCAFIPYEFFGILDITLSMLYRKAGYRTVVSDDFALGHMLAGAREMAGVKEKYLTEFSGSMSQWLKQHPELKANYDEYFKNICQE